MKLSTRGRYGIHAMYELARGFGGAPMSIKAIAEKQDIPEAYLEQIIAVLRRDELVTSIRGAQGGYKLAKAPSQYTVGEILRLTEGTLSPVDCVDQDPVECPRSADCPTLPIWRHLSEIVNEYLDSVTLQDILDQQQKHYANNYII